ncbi:MAG: hypothetical protein II200_09270, partial [Bacteroidaceae bacterium]|nr:hypothetical protein [Bacteroidaceae bacterium]
MHKTAFLCKYAHIYARAVKVDFAKRDVNCKLQDSKFRGQMLKSFKFAKKANLDFAQKCCIFVLWKGKLHSFPFFRPQKQQKQGQRLLKQALMLLKLPPMLFFR